MKQCTTLWLITTELSCLAPPSWRHSKSHSNPDRDHPPATLKCIAIANFHLQACSSSISLRTHDVGNDPHKDASHVGQLDHVDHQCENQCRYRRWDIHPIVGTLHEVSNDHGLITWPFQKIQPPRAGKKGKVKKPK